MGGSEINSLIVWQELTFLLEKKQPVVALSHIKTKFVF